MAASNMQLVCLSLVQQDQAVHGNLVIEEYVNAERNREFRFISYLEDVGVYVLRSSGRERSNEGGIYINSSCPLYDSRRVPGIGSSQHIKHIVLKYLRNLG